MASIADPLTKPVWPDVDDGIAKAVVGILSDAISPLRDIKDAREVPDLFKSVTLGFNSTMAAVEDHISGKKPLGALFICRSDIPATLSQPFALASSAGNIRLVALPRGSRDQLTTAAGREASIIGVHDGLDQLLKLVKHVGPAETSWAYVPAKLVPRKPTNKR